jgi:hypothetical protein
MKQSIPALQNTQDKMEKIDGTTEIALDAISENLIKHHLNSFVDNDLDALMSDYTNESVLITQPATYTGINAIKGFFMDLITHFPKQQSSLILDKMAINGALVYIVWHANTPSLEVPLGSDTFVIKNGKIYQQTFVGKLQFIN